MKATFWQNFNIVIILILMSFTALEKSHAQSSNAHFDGILQIMVEDYSNGKSLEHNYLKTDKKKIELHGKISPKLKSGDKIRVHGKLKQTAATEELVLDSGTNSVELLTAAYSTSIGEQRVAVILVNFSDDTSQPQTLATVQNLVFTNMAGYYKEASFNQTTVSGNVFGYYTISMSKSSCDPYGLASAADQAATSAGVVLSNYQRKIYMFPRNGCTWAGLGNVGGSNTQAWANGSFALITVGHEFGHNLGLHHAHSLNCDLSALGNSCVTSDYGDTADMMGNYRAAHFGAAAKAALGWFTSSQIISATNTNRYFIEPYETNNLGLKAIKIPRGNGLYYYLEYRQGLGYDSVLSTTGNLTKGVIVRSVSEGDTTSFNQLDMTPQSNTASSYGELADGALNIGQSYTDSAAKVTITLVSADANGATLDVNFGGTVSDVTPPSVMLTSPTAGTIVSNSYTLSANASDNVAVMQVAFFVDGVQVGTDSTSPYSVMINSSSLSNSNHTFGAQATDTSGNKSSLNQVIASVANIPADTIAPSVPSSLSAQAASCNQINLAWSISTDNGGSGLKGYNIYSSNGTLLKTVASNSTSLSSLYQLTSYSYQVAAIDNAGNLSAKSSIASASTPSCPAADTSAPIVSIASPLNGSVIPVRSSITISGSASDNIGVSRIEVYVNSSLICTSVRSSYSCIWKVPAKARSNLIDVRAYDAAGNMGTKQITINSTR